jgi:hypothetical protein
MIQCECFEVCKWIYYIFLMIMPFYKFILTSCECIPNSMVFFLNYYYYFFNEEIKELTNPTKGCLRIFQKNSKAQFYFCFAMSHFDWSFTKTYATINSFFLSRSDYSGVIPRYIFKCAFCLTSLLQYNFY